MTIRKLQFKRYANTVVSTTIGADGELIVDKTNSTITVHDGTTPGGSRLATENFVLNNTATNNFAQSAYNKANTVINYLPLTGGTLSGDLTVQGNISLSGYSTTYTSNIAVVAEPILYLASNNSSDLVDIGFYGNFVGNGSTSFSHYQHTGLIRDFSDQKWKLFSNVSEPQASNSYVDFSNAVYDTLKVGTIEAFTANISNLDLSIAPAIGGTTANTGTFTTLTATGQTSLGGAAGSEGLRVGTTASSVNFWYAIGSATNAGVQFRPSGADASIAALFSSKGTNQVSFYTNTFGSEQARIAHTASAVNYVQVTGGATGVAPTISAQGSDAAVGFTFNTKSSGTYTFQTNGTTRLLVNSGGTVQMGYTNANPSFTAVGQTSQVNGLQVAGSATGAAPILSAIGSDTNISQVFQPKGTGAIDLAAGSSGVNISNGGTVTALTRTATGFSYTSIPSVAITAPTTAGGVQATASVGSMVTTGAAVVSGGTGYTLNDTITLVGGTSTGITGTLTVTGVSGGVITSASPLNFGQYSVLPTNPVSVTGGTGSGATFNITYGIGSNPSFTITNAGSGYVEQPTVSFSGGGGSGATAYATVGGIPTIKTVNSALSFSTDIGELFRITNSAGTTTTPAYLSVLGGGSTGISQYASGGGSAITLSFISKGTSPINFATGGTTSNQQFAVSHTASAVNYVQVTGAATGGVPNISAQGSDGAIGLTLQSKSASILFLTRSGQNRSFNIADTNSPVNYLQAQGSTTGLGLQFSAQGGDTNISQVFQPKGTGAIDLAAGSSGVNISNGGTVTAITFTNAGTTAYSSIPSVAISAPTTAGGVQATATAQMRASQGSTTLASGGTGYTAGDVLTLSGGTFTTASQITVNTVSAGVIATFTVTGIGSGYSVLPTNPVSVTGGTGSGATFNLAWGVSGFTITNAGSGYVEQPTVSFSGGGGSGAAAYATVGSGTVVKSIGNPLSFYTPSGEAFRISDIGVTSAAYWAAYGGASIPELRASGSGIISVTGANSIQFRTNVSTEQLRIAHTASAVNYVQVTGAATGNQPVISTQGSDTNVILNIASKGNASIIFNANSAEQFRTGAVASAVNSLQLNGATTGNSPSLQARGTDTDIDLTFTPKGAGYIKFGTLTATADTAISGYITIKDSGGTLRKLAVIT